MSESCKIPSEQDLDVPDRPATQQIISKSKAQSLARSSAPLCQENNFVGENDNFKTPPRDRRHTCKDMPRTSMLRESEY